MEKLEELSIFLLLTIFVSVIPEEVHQSKTFLINCGSNSSVNADGRRWVGDSVAAGNNNFTLSSSGIAVKSNTSSIDHSIYEPLYRTARIFISDLNYSFIGIQGNHFLRLHFYPFPFENYDVNQSSFDVIANGIKLVSEFSVHGEISDKDINSSSYNSLVKEYFIEIHLDVLVIEFISTKGSFGFVNAIEIVPVIDKLFANSVSKVGGNEVNLDLSERGIETMYRLNVGGPDIKTNSDSGLWRKWEMDSSFMINVDAGIDVSNTSSISYASINDSLVAPLLVYETARIMSNAEVLERRLNMSWKFKADPGFDYLIRLHFCELFYEKPNQRIFRIFINNRTAADNFDVYRQAGGTNKAFYKDYFDVLPSKINTLWVQLGPDTAVGASGTDALLNGLEIFKLSRNGNLAYREKYSSDRKSSRNSKRWILLGAIGAGVLTVLVFAVILFIVCHCGKNSNSSDSKHKKTLRPLFLIGDSMANVKGSQNTYGSIAASTRGGKRFTLSEIRAATKTFDDSLVIGVGGFGKVYKGEILDGTVVAIKRANPQSEQGLAEFETEIEMLSKLRHRHLVSLIGFCEEQNEMILIYEYMANGTLRNHLFGSNLPCLTFKQRLEACIGSARGLHYLHTGAERGIIHRDVKTTNILLDEKFVAKMSDFGLSKDGSALEHTHVSTAVKGSFGYLDPEYFRRQQLTEKSDVYSFGVVLFEVVCARAVINPSLPRDQINLAEWAMKWQRQRSLEQILDPRLKDSYCLESLKKFGEIAEKCLADEGKNRPTMGEVLWHLEYVLQLHEAWMLASAVDQVPKDNE